MNSRTYLQIKHAAQAHALQAQISIHNLSSAQERAIFTVHKYTISSAHTH